jgi:hypothetical protein
VADLTIVCEDCGQEFVWTEGEQQFYGDKGLERPKYCMICRARRKAQERDPGAGAKGD